MWNLTLGTLLYNEIIFIKCGELSDPLMLVMQSPLRKYAKGMILLTRS